MNQSYKNPAIKTQPFKSSTSLVTKASQLVEAGQYNEALRVLASFGHPNDEVRNAICVCLMRMDRAAEAVRQYRSFVVQPGCMWTKPELPVIYRTNFAVALLLNGLTMGGRDTLGEILEQTHPSVVRLRTAMKKWEAKLPFSQWLSWKLGLVPATLVSIDFLPGEFFEASDTTNSYLNAAPDSTTSPLTQVV